MALFRDRELSYFTTINTHLVDSEAAAVELNDLVLHIF